MSKIEQLIDEIEEYVEGCKPAPFSQTKIIVQKEQLYELLTELRLKTPEEIKRYQKIIAQKDKIISDAQAQAEQMIAETEAYAAALVEEHEIMLKAYEKAQQTIDAANAQAQDIVDAASKEGEEIRIGALAYSEELIANIQNRVESSLYILRTNSEGLINGLSENLATLISNHEALSSQLSQVVMDEDHKVAAATATVDDIEDIDEDDDEVPEDLEDDDIEDEDVVDEDEDEDEDFDDDDEDDYDDID